MNQEEREPLKGKKSGAGSAAKLKGSRPEKAKQAAQHEVQEESKGPRGDEEEKKEEEFITVSIRRSVTQVHYLQNLAPVADEEPHHISSEQTPAPLLQARATNSTLMSQIIGHDAASEPSPDQDKRNPEDSSEGGAKSVYSRMLGKGEQKEAAEEAVST